MGYAVKEDGSFRAVDDKSWCVDGEKYQEDQPESIEITVGADVLRRVAYADPLTGSDRYFAEAMSLIATGFAIDSPEVKNLFKEGLAAKEAIKLKYPDEEV